MAAHEWRVNMTHPSCRFISPRTLYGHVTGLFTGNLPHFSKNPVNIHEKSHNMSIKRKGANVRVGANGHFTPGNSLVDLRWAPGTRPPRVQILSFSCSFRQKFEK